MDPVALWDEHSETIISYATTLGTALLFLVVGVIAAGWLSGVARRGLAKAKVDQTLTLFLSKLVRWLVLVIVVMAALGKFGLDMTSFAAILAAAGFAIGMALQGSLGNFAAGVMLLIFRPFKVEQVISAGGVTGKVVEIGIFTTSFDTPDNRRIIVPNNSIFSSTIENVSFHAKRRVDVAVGVDYGADIDKTRAVLLQAAGSLEMGLKDPAPAVVLLELGASSVDWTVRLWVDAADFWPAKDALTRAVKMHLDEAGIPIPFPQLDVHMNKVDG